MGLATFIKNLRDLLNKTERDLTFSDYADQIYLRLVEKGLEYPWIHEFMKTDDGADYVVVSNAGKLWKYPITVKNGIVECGEGIEVEIVYQEVRAKTYTKRTKDGKLRYLSIASASVLNRVGEIDSSELFESFEKNFEERSKDAYLQFYHLGEKFRFGSFDGCARYGNLLITWGIIDEDTALGKAAERAFSTGKWGISIGFMPTAEPEIIENNIRVFKEGYLVEQSVLLEEHAASYFTTIKGSSIKENRMNKDQLEQALKDFLGGEEQVAEELLEEADTRERVIKEQKLITRDAEVKDINKEEEGEVIDIDASEVELEVSVELTDELKSAIKDEVAKVAAEYLAPVQQSYKSIKEQYEALEEKLKERNQQVQAIVEADEDKPAINKRKVMVHYTATGRAQEQTDSDDVNVTELIKERKGRKNE